MPPPSPNTPAPPGQEQCDEVDEVYQWRLDELCRAGYESDDAERIADDTTIDLHDAVGLLERGCPLSVAVKILAPLALILVALVAVGAARAGVQVVYVTNQSTNVTDAELADALPAFQAAVTEDFAPAWRLETVELRQAPEPDAGGWTITLVDQPSCWFCDGYHDVIGDPYAIVGTGGTDWQISFSHELFEMVGNPYVTAGVLVGRRWYAKEACDPVEMDWLGYLRETPSGRYAHISDFVLLGWFRRGTRGPWDFTSHTRRPLQILKDGFQLVWGGRSWTIRSD